MGFFVVFLAHDLRVPRDPELEHAAWNDSYHEVRSLALWHG